MFSNISCFGSILKCSFTLIVIVSSSSVISYSTSPKNTYNVLSEMVNDGCDCGTLIPDAELPAST